MKQFTHTIGVIIFALVTGACGKSGDNSGGATPGGGKKLKLALISNNAATFWTDQFFKNRNQKKLNR